jgi:hypothetical protein
VYFKKDQCFNKTDISHHCKEQDLEISVVQLENKTCNLITLSLHRALKGDFNLFVRGSHATLQYLYNPKPEFLICGDIN